jgi:hypothetical protein
MRFGADIPDVYNLGMDVATKIRSLREIAGLSQAELAKMARTTQPALSAYESGARRPNDKTIRRIVEAAGVRPSEILDRHHDEVIEVVAAHRGDGVWVFGSVARGEDSFESDIDLLVRMTPGASLLDVAAMYRELNDLLGVSVDVVTEGSLRPDRDMDILADARPF